MTTPEILAPVASLTVPDAAMLTSRAQRTLAFVETFPIASAEDYTLAADELRAIKQRAAALEVQRTGITGPLNQVLRAVNDLFRGPSEMLSRGEQLLKSKMLAWDQEQERIAAEQRRRAEEAAAVERRRLEEEAAARQREAQDQARAAATAQAAGDEQAAALASANAQRAAAEAQTAATTAQLVTAPVGLVVAQKAAGISTSTKVDFEVTDLLALVRHVAEHPELVNLVVADSTRLRQYVRGLGTACVLPGVRVFPTKVMSARAA